MMLYGLNFLVDQLLQELMLKIQHWQTVITKGKCKTSNIRKIYKVWEPSKSVYRDQATRFKTVLFQHYP